MKKLLTNYSYILLAIVALAIFFILGLNRLDKDISDQYKQYTIQQNDTIWEIAKQYEIDQNNQQEFVTWVQEHNDIDVNFVKPGQKIIIPISKHTNDQKLLADGN